MAKKKMTGEVTEPKERAAVGRERRLALALRAVLDQRDDDNPNNTAYADAESLLSDMGYGALEGTAKRITRINEQLKAAVEAGDGDTIAALGKELKTAKSGKAPRVKKDAPSE